MGASLLALVKSIYWTLNFSSFKQRKGNNIRDFKIQRRGRQQERQKKTIGLISKTTTSHVHHVHFFPVFARLRRENA